MRNRWQLSYSVLVRLRWLVHAAGFLGILTLGYASWQVSSSIQEWRTQIEEQIARDQQTLREAKKIEQQLAEAMMHSENTSASFRSLRSRVPNRLIDSDIVRELSKVIAACDCKLNDFHPVGRQVINTSELKCQVRSFQLSMEGSYAGLFAFARQFDDLPFLMQLRKLHWFAPIATQSNMRIELEIGILYEPQWGESTLLATDRT